MALFSAAYLAEEVRGGLQAIPRGQYEAAAALGLGYAQTMGLIILPQALKIVIPGIVNSFIALFKDTSLVLIIGLFDLLGIVQQSIQADSRWFSPTTAATGYVFAGAVFWAVLLRHVALRRGGGGPLRRVGGGLSGTTATAPPPCGGGQGGRGSERRPSGCPALPNFQPSGFPPP